MTTRKWQQKRIERLERLIESDNSSVDVNIVEVSPENKFALKRSNISAL